MPTVTSWQDTLYVFTRADQPRMMSPNMSSVGQNIKRLRELRGFKTGRAFARALGVESTRVADWETDRYDVPSLHTLLKIGKVLRVSLDDLLAGYDRDYDLIRNRDLTRHGTELQPQDAQIATLQAHYDHLYNDAQGLANALLEALSDHPAAASGVPSTFRKTG